MNAKPLRRIVLVAACAASLGACGNRAGHDSQWYLAHADELPKKLDACKAHPDTSPHDPECAAATEAFLVWYTKSGLAARQAQTEADEVDRRLTPPAASQGSPVSQPSSPSQASPSTAASADASPPAAPASARGSP